MKIRMGFVSNSSSSSFVVKGWEIKDPNKVIEKIGQIFNNCEQILEYLLEYGWAEASEQFPNNLRIMSPDDGETYFLGLYYRCYDGWNVVPWDEKDEERLKEVQKVLGFSKPDLFTGEGYS